MIDINNLTRIQAKEQVLMKIVKDILLKEKLKDKIDISIALISEKQIQKLNRKYRDKDRVTDVLSFGLTAAEGSLNKIGGFRNGEIVICPAEVKRNARFDKIHFDRELYRVLIHGVLHLLGYDHEKSEVKAKKMREKEDYYFSNIK